MKTRYIILFFTCLGLVACRDEIIPSKGKTRIFVFTGQSNMAGKGITSELPTQYFESDDRIRMIHKLESKMFSPVGTTFGPEVGFSEEYKKLYPNDTLIIVKVAKGGASIVCWDIHWKPDTAVKYDLHRQGNIYDSLLVYIGIALSQHKNAELSGVLFLQGEKDTEEPMGTSTSYKKRLHEFIANLRKDVNNPQLPFIIASYRNDGLLDDLTQVTGYKEALPRHFDVYQSHYTTQFEVSNTSYLGLKDLLTHRDLGYDDGHYETQGQLTLGKMFAQKYFDEFNK